VQMMCARIGKVTGQGLAGNLSKRFPRWLLLTLVIALLGANTINIAADLAGMADAASMLCRINSHWFVVAFALLISWATVKLEYRQIAITGQSVPIFVQVVWSFLISARILMRRLDSRRSRLRALPFVSERRNISMTC